MHLVTIESGPSGLERTDREAQVDNRKTETRADGTHTVLVVGGDSILSSNVTEALGRNCQVLLREGSREALDCLQESRIDLVLVDLDLGIGNVHVHRLIRVEGVDTNNLRLDARPNPRALRCMVVLLGGKHLLVKMRAEAPEVPGERVPVGSNDGTGAYDREVPVFGRLYLDHKVYHSPPGLVEVAGMGGLHRLEVGLYYEYLQKHNFDIRLVWRTLNGK